MTDVGYVAMVDEPAPVKPKHGYERVRVAGMSPQEVMALPTRNRAERRRKERLCRMIVRRIQKARGRHV